jgi:hypothetical protein
MVYVIQVCRQLSSRIRMELHEFYLDPVSDSSSVHHQELLTVHSAMVYVIQVCRELSSRIRMELYDFHLDPVSDSCLQTCMTYTIAGCTVNNSWWWTEELSETCRASFRNKYGELVYLVGFIIRKFVTVHGQLYVKRQCKVVYLVFFILYFLIFLFCTMTTQCTINWQIIAPLLHVSTLLCHPQGALS